MSLEMRQAPSPNHDARPDDQPIDMLILHYTGMRSGQAALDRLRDPASQLSSHYVVEEDGTVFQLVAEERRAWHAGISHWRGNPALNSRSVGIEIVNPGHEWGYLDFPALQMASLCDLCLGILERHPIPARNVVAHSDVAPDRKQDPGEKFDWRQFSEQGVGLFPAGVPGHSLENPLRDAASLAPVRSALIRIGYLVAPQGPDDAGLAGVLRAFQRHWRAEAITGRADVGTVARLQAVAGLCAKAC